MTQPIHNGHVKLMYVNAMLHYCKSMININTVNFCVILSYSWMKARSSLSNMMAKQS